MVIEEGADENRNALNNRWALWPGGIVPYQFDNSHSAFSFYIPLNMLISMLFTVMAFIQNWAWISQGVIILHFVIVFGDMHEPGLSVAKLTIWYFF